MITFTDTTAQTTAKMLQGFFFGWPNPPSADTHLKLLRNSYRVVLALDDETGQVVGFAAAISDGVLTAHITLLEVLPEYQRKGIGQELMLRMLDQLAGLYAVDLVCDPELQPFYASLGMQRTSAMMTLNYDLQSGPDRLKGEQTGH